MVYSLDRVNVSLNRSTHAKGGTAFSGNTTMTYSKTITPVPVHLPVFDKEVQTDGFQTNITFVVNSQEQFGEYVLIVSNGIGATPHSVEIIPEGLRLTKICFAFHKCLIHSCLF